MKQVSSFLWYGPFSQILVDLVDMDHVAGDAGVLSHLIG